jgi:DNA repair exonuclease SbcCD ATPase subunit
MILRSIEVEGFRCFDRVLRVADFAPGLNVLHGPNGAGKSTLLRALQHVMVDSYSLSGAAVKQAMSPWGRALSPRICAEFSHGADVWRIEKRFLASPSAKLERLEAGVFRPVADGKEADQRIREMLLAEGAAKGIAKDVHMGLLQVLWTPQGAPLLPEWSAGVRTTLQEAFGAALSSRAADDLSDLVDGRADVYFTAMGAVKKSSPVNALQAEQSRLRTEALALQTQWQTAGANRETLVRLRERVAGSESQLATLRPALEQARARQRELAEATSAELIARQLFDGLDGRVRQWRSDLATRLQGETQLQTVRGTHDAARRALDAGQAAGPKIAALERELELLQQSGVDAKAWGELLRYRELSASAVALREQRDGLRAPAAAGMAELRELHQRLQVKEAALDAASLKLTIEAEAALVVETDGATRSVFAGDSLELTGAQAISLRIPNVARFTASSANAQAAGLEAEVSRLREKLARLLDGDTLPLLEERFGRRDQLQRELDAREAELRPLAARRGELEELAARRLDWVANPPDIDAIRARFRDCRRELEVLKSQFDLPALAAAEATASAVVLAAETQLAQVNARLAQYAAAGALDELESQRTDAASRHAAASARLAAVKDTGVADPVSLEQKLNSVQAALDADREAAARLDGELAVLQNQNVYSRLAETEERLAVCTDELERERRRAEALKLLKETLAVAKRTMSASLPDRIAEFATANWRRIAGPSAHAIRVDDTWTPAGLLVPGADARLDELSGGEAEQVAFATRLALATRLAQAGPQLAVFDDAFLATDPHRAARILELLAESAETLQILILTCHPERYAQLPGVRQFDLEKLKQ